MALLGIIKVYRSISTDALCVLTGCLPIQIILAKELSYYNTLKDRRNYIIQDTSITIDNLMTKHPSYSFPEYYKLNNLQILDDTYSDKSQLNQDLTIYTDGSVTDSGTAAAFTVEKDTSFIFENAFRLHNLNSIYQAELYAIH